MGSDTASFPRIHEETSVNINHRVKVDLTPRGLEVLRAYVFNERRRLNMFETDDPDKEVEEAIRLLYRREDVYVFQLYALMAIFGPDLPSWATSDSRYMPFERNEVILLPGS